MLFDILEYNIPLAIATYLIFFTIFIITFKKFITNIADPLVFHILWLSSQATFFVIYLNKYHISHSFTIFTLSLFFYILGLRVFIPIYETKKRTLIKKGNPEKILGKKKWKFITYLLLALTIYSYKGFLEYALQSNTFAELFLYRFIDLQGRNAIERILSSSIYFLFFFLFYGIQYKYSKYLPYVGILTVATLGILSGGRSTLITLATFAGSYLFFFSEKIKYESIKKYNKTIVLFVIVAVLAAIFVSSFYEKDSSFSSASLIIFNRIFAAPDGIEYYLKYKGEENIKSGIYPFLMAVFGVYLKNIFDLEYKNIGWQLTELVVGYVDFAQGANYTFMLQGVVFNHYTAPLYAILIAWLVAKLRYSYSKRSSTAPFAFALSCISFAAASDLEYFIFLTISLSITYFILVYPIIKMKK